MSYINLTLRAEGKADFAAAREAFRAIVEELRGRGFAVTGGADGSDSAIGGYTLHSGDVLTEAEQKASLKAEDAAFKEARAEAAKTPSQHAADATKAETAAAAETKRVDAAQAKADERTAADAARATTKANAAAVVTPTVAAANQRRADARVTANEQKAADAKVAADAAKARA